MWPYIFPSVNTGRSNSHILNVISNGQGLLQDTPELFLMGPALPSGACPWMLERPPQPVQRWLSCWEKPHVLLCPSLSSSFICILSLRCTTVTEDVLLNLEVVVYGHPYN